MGDDAQDHHDRWVWLQQASDDGDRWYIWSNGPGDSAGLADGDRFDNAEASELAARVLHRWLTALPFDQRLELEDLWMRVLVWRVGRVTDGYPATSASHDLTKPAKFCMELIHNDKIAPDAVQVATPLQITHVGTSHLLPYLAALARRFPPHPLV